MTHSPIQPARMGPVPLSVLALLTPLLSLAAEVQQLPPVTVTGTEASTRFDGSGVSEEDLAVRRAISGETAGLLSDVPGVALNAAGGISSLPSIHGLADDRLRILVDGMSLISACPNHMNPPLSYLDPSQIKSIKVWAGISPVSVGGDSIGGTIAVESADPEFAEPGRGTLTKGEIGGGYRSNGDAYRGHLSATQAGEHVSLRYDGSYAQSDNYDAGGDFKDFAATGRPGRDLPLDEVGSTAYKVQSHQLGLALKDGEQLLEAKAGYQDIPYQNYPNQRMDLVDNTQSRFNLRYRNRYQWGSLDARAYYEDVDHKMDFGDDKQFIYGAAPGIVAPGMPMYTESQNIGGKLMGSIDLNEADVLRLGGEYQRYRLDDWWPPSPADLTGMLDAQGEQATVGGMAPNTFRNINDGQRDRMALFAEWERAISAQWSTLLGGRYERVTTDTGPVQGYNDVNAGYAQSAAAFNARDRERDDNNVDLTALARYLIDPTRDLEFGYAMKTRSPNLYERYAWSRNAMAAIMNNFVGDGNGYVGNPDLDPETAHTVSATFDWHSADRARGLQVTPFYTYVTDYIDAQRCAGSGMMMDAICAGPANATARDRFVILDYVNATAALYGIDLSGYLPLAETALGAFGLKGLVNYTKGENRDTNDGLYNIMPLNARFALTHAWGPWDNAMELVLVDAKDDLSDVRNEIETDSYALINLRGGYDKQRLRLDFGVENLFDTNYDLPTGGAYVGQGTTMSINGVPWGIAVPGLGRTFYAAATLKF